MSNYEGPFEVAKLGFEWHIRDSHRRTMLKIDASGLDYNKEKEATGLVNHLVELLNMEAKAIKTGILPELNGDMAKQMNRELNENGGTPDKVSINGHIVEVPPQGDLSPAIRAVLCKTDRKKLEVVEKKRETLIGKFAEKYAEDVKEPVAA